MINLKGIGDMETFILVGIKPGSVYRSLGSSLPGLASDAIPPESSNTDRRHAPD